MASLGLGVAAGGVAVIFIVLTEAEVIAEEETLGVISAELRAWGVILLALGMLGYQAVELVFVRHQRGGFIFHAVLAGTFALVAAGLIALRLT